MRIRTFFSLAKSGRLRLLIKTTKFFKPFYRFSFAASAASCGLLRFLQDEGKSIDEIAGHFSPNLPPELVPALSAWLKLGVSLGELGIKDERYYPKSFLAQEFAGERNDDVAALAEEVVSMHHRLIFETPRMLSSGKQWTMEDQDGRLIARSSRIMSPFIFQTIDWAIPKDQVLRLLEIGCGSGVYIKYAAQRNSKLEIMGLEYQPEVADLARLSLETTDLKNRVSIHATDIRNLSRDERFDIVTLYNIIYYFPIADRIPLLKKIAEHLNPGGRIVLSTSCSGGSLGMEVLNLWSSSTLGCGPLPSKVEMEGQLKSAGFVNILVKKVIPGEEYFAFVAFVPDSERGSSP